MTNYQIYVQMKKRAGEVFFKVDEKEGRKLNHEATVFAEENFTIGDFDEFVNSTFGSLHGFAIRWRNEYIAKQKAKKEN